MSVDERARAGMFLAMQYPVEVPGVSVSNFLRSAATAVRGEAPKLRHWVKEVKAAMALLEIDPAFAERNVNEGFSGGEKKRHEILQLELLKPKIAILDETDSGLDVDALRVVSEGVNRYAETEHGGVLLITHYTRILRYIHPEFVHVFVGGRIAESGGPELADELEAERLRALHASGGHGGLIMTSVSRRRWISRRSAPISRSSSVSCAVEISWRTWIPVRRHSDRCRCSTPSASSCSRPTARCIAARTS